MKFVHISDLHIGKRVYDFSMIEDQRYILNQIIQIIKDSDADGVFIAGDLYDKTIPSAEAVALCDEFLTNLAHLDRDIFIISGNHDCPERVAFGAKIMETAKIHICASFQEALHCVTVTDAYGPVNVYMLPFIKPSFVRRYFEDPIESYTDAVQTIMNHTTFDLSARNVLIAHQFVTGAMRSESEDVTVGGLDNVDAQVFEPFDYVALGHIHGPQKAGRETIRYCGTPLKYSFSEAKQDKCVTIVSMDMNQDGQKQPVHITTIPLKPLHDLLEIKGSYMELTLRDYYLNMDTKAYYHVTLTDEEDIPDAIGKLRSIYPNIMKLDYDNTRTRNTQTVTQIAEVDKKTPLQLFKEFYELQNNQEMTEQQLTYVSELIERIWQ